MRADSIFSALTAENTAAEIDLILAADYSRRRTVILLEGEDDIKLFRFLVSDDTVLIKAYGASTTVDKFIPAVYPNEKRVIGIRDRDYLEKGAFPRIFFCDRCCMEMMVVSDLPSFARVAVNFYRGPLTPERLRYEILAGLYYFSLARKLSYKLRLGLRLADTDLARIAAPGVKASPREVIKFVGSYNRSKRFPEGFVRGIMRARVPSVDEMLDITNGHDFTEVLGHYVNERPAGGKKRGMSSRELGAALRCAYSLSAFRGTELCAALTDYGRENALEIVAKE